MLLIVGLGNPGPQYETTRHNAGFLLVDELATKFSIPLKDAGKFGGHIGKGDIFGTAAIILKPMTFMNRSGQSVARVMSFYNIEASHLIVIYDDLDLDSGKVKMRIGGGHGGHNGVRDIIEKIGAAEFYRIKLGIGRPGLSTGTHKVSVLPDRDKNGFDKGLNKGSEKISPEILIPKERSPKPQMPVTDWVLGQLSDQELLALQNEVFQDACKRLEEITKQLRSK